MRWPTITPGRLVYLLKRDLARGPVSAWYDYVVAPKIFAWRSPWMDRPLESVSVHVLAGRSQFGLMLWMLASWFHYTERNWRVVVHDDGTCTPSQKSALQACIPGARLIPAAESDRIIMSRLASFPLCWAYRDRHPLAKKIFDIPLLVEEERFLILDADVIFFQRPTDLLEWVDDPSDKTCWFNEDFQEPSPVSLQNLEEHVGFPIWPKVNSGLCLLNRDVLDLDFCEEAMQRADLLSVNLWRVEQLLFALGASRLGKGGLLPPTYEVSANWRRRKAAVARHYVGIVRDRFYAEGVRELARVLL